uniref:NADH dehydrogenase subunit 5 n=1 Tax=Iphicrates gressitti TaxID=2969360 RepID=UPI002176B287|nr:NADH dehydrogenase subunit 5 [Iphicrates gressitti]UUJ37771.1 NADH dehydrogenase subunit 5 [Iphicrates gressitti]
MYYFWSFFVMFFSVIFYLYGLYFLFYDYIIMLDWEIISLNSCSLVMTFLLDWISLLFIGSVLFISSMVIVYSSTYMNNDKNMSRFLYLVILFIISMCFMIISPNMISILLGWDGLGLVSYCLVIYFNNYNSYNAGMLTILTNRIGDVAILLSISILFNMGSWYFIYYFYYISSLGIYLLLFSVLAAFTKSAQIPFSSWLPAAMAAPTPVSALVHSSTLVTAGIYLMIRFNNFFSFNTDFFLLLSVLTMFMSGLCANFEYDMKKIIALSTLSQLGLMMSVFFMGYPIVAFFHLLTHAFFKALLFMCAGLFIHSVNDTQDIRFMGGFLNNFPYTSSCFGIANLSLCGLPFLSGFYSKDLSLEFMTLNLFNLFIYLIFYISVGLTAMYSLRLLYYCLFGYYNLLSYNSYGEDYNMTLSMFFLVLMGIMSGSFLSWLLFPFPIVVVVPLVLKLMALFFVFLGGWLGYQLCFYYGGFLYGLKNMFVYNFISGMWFMPNFSTYTIYSSSYSLSLYYMKFLDYGWGEYLISNMMLMMFIYLSKINSYIQNNNLKIYFVLFLLITFILMI